jgi:hypothetical protein
MWRTFTLLLARFFGAALIACCTGSSEPAALEVPLEYTTITAAIAAASDGDTVRVAPGYYAENIDFLGKSIVITSHFDQRNDWRVVTSTIIDGSSFTDPDAASTVTFSSGEGPASVLQGFTITGGHGTVWVDPQFPSYTWRGGGGIFCYQSSPTIRFNLVKANLSENHGDVNGAQAGGILCFGGDPVIANTIVTHNQAEYGGGLVVDYSGATIRNTIISHNTCRPTYGGGGVWTIGSGPAPILLENVAIVGNSSPSRGGALYVWGGTVSISSSIIWGNDQVYGGPIHTVGGGVAQVSFSDIEGGHQGEGNIELDPLFVIPATCLLDPSSPCVDAGDPDPALQDVEDPASSGSAMWPAAGGLRNDMGPYGGPASRYLGFGSEPTVVPIVHGNAS